jgi:hypothetical protein
MKARLRSRYEGNRYIERMTYPLKSSVKNAAERELLESPLVFETRDRHARSGRSLKKKNQIEEVKSRDLRVAAFSFYAGSSRKRLFRFFFGRIPSRRSFASRTCIPSSGRVWLALVGTS